MTIKHMIDGWRRAEYQSMQAERLSDGAKISDQAYEIGYLQARLRDAEAEIEYLREDNKWMSQELEKLGEEDNVGTYLFGHVRAIKWRLLGDRDPQKLSIKDKRILNLQLLAIGEYTLRWYATSYRLSEAMAAEIQGNRYRVTPEDARRLSEQLQHMAKVAHLNDRTEWVKRRLAWLKEHVRFDGESTLPNPQSVGNPFEWKPGATILEDNAYGLRNLLLR